MREYQNLVFSVCLKLTGDYFVSEDITQETFLAAYRHWDTFDGQNEKAWLCRIAGNKCIDWKRRAARKEAVAEEDAFMERPSNEMEPLQEVLCKEVTEKLSESCKALSPPYNETAEKYFLKGLTAKEIAKESGVGLKTVQTRIYRARQMLQKTIRKEELVS
ncbi:MAG: RNA polymerase sigma factor [Lachnospiraceae bacterium]|jgi:RNA polymerase sigma-70 factor (ECF subfamily)|nr:RNA polymerase sigma factor [Lachnospiraceae bacterium]